MDRRQPERGIAPALAADAENIEALKPQVVVPGHFLPGAAQTLASVHFTQKYLTTLEAELPKAKDSAALIEAMKSTTRR